MSRSGSMSGHAMNRLEDVKGEDAASEGAAQSHLRILSLMYGCPTNVDHPLVSGEVKNTFYLSRGLSRRGHEVTIVSARRSGAGQPRMMHRSWTIDEMTVHETGPGRMRGIGFYLTRTINMVPPLRELVRNMWPDVVHAHTPGLALAAMIVRGCRTGPWFPIVLSAHGTYAPELEADLEGRTWVDRLRRLNGWVQVRIDAYTFQHVDALISMSKFQTREMRSIYRVKAREIHVVPNGIDRTVYRPDGARGRAWREKHGLQHPRIILLVGRFVRKKGFHVLVKAAREISHECPDVRFLFVGAEVDRSGYMKDVKRLVEHHGSQDLFHWKIEVPESEMPAVYNAADLTVVPSLGYESIPTVVLESMASGTPVLATGKWGVPEALTEPDALLPEGNAEALARRVLKVFKDPECRERLLKAQDRAVEKFCLERIVDLNEQIYENVRQPYENSCGAPIGDGE
jgi:glycosyltransferase involved in cell wall biosynthesis